MRKKMKSTLIGAVVVCSLLAVFLLPQGAAASCFCLSERFSGSASAIGQTCPEAQSNLANAIFSSADSSCQYRGYAGACNVVIRTGTCSYDPYNPGFMRLDGTFKYSCLLCS